LCCKPVGGKVDSGGLGTEVSHWGPGQSPPEAEEYLLNLITIFTFLRIKHSFYCNFVINEYNNFD